MAEELHIPSGCTWPRTIAISLWTMGLGVVESFIVTGRGIRLLDMTPELTREAHTRLLAHAVLERAVAAGCVTRLRKPSVMSTWSLRRCRSNAM